MLAAVTGYLIGSLPLGFLAGRRLGGVDLREVGSKNVGATNMYRVSGARLGATVMALDMAKGALAVGVASLVSTRDAEIAAAALGAVAGHVYPVWLRGRGGKGVATACGAFAVLVPQATLLALGAFSVAVALTRVVSVASVVASVTLPVGAVATGATAAIAWGACGAAVLVVWRHRSNLRRLVRGTEQRIGVHWGRGA